MTLQFDHIIHYVFDPLEVSQELNDFGILNQYGGEHSRGGTFNTLSYFGLKYIEYIGIKDAKAFEDQIPQLAKFSPIAALAKRRNEEGLIAIALRSSNLKTLANKLHEKGASVEGPYPLSRKTPQGETLSWELLYAGEDQLEIPLPFFIDWGLTDEERFKKLQEQGYVAPHAKGDLKLSNVVFAVRSFEHSIEKWKTYLDLEEIKLDVGFHEAVEYRTLTLDDLNLIFVKPIENGEVQAFLEKAGPGIFQLQFKGAKQKEKLIFHNAIYEFR